MSVIKVAILGFGTVGEGVYRTIQSHSDELYSTLGKKVEVAAVLIKNTEKQRNISEDVLLTTDIEEIFRLPQLDIVVEAIVNKEPTFTFLKKAIERGCHIVTANKEMFAHHGKKLLEIAEENNVSVGFEATVAGGIPVIQTFRQLLNINRVKQIQGILNGTSNFILTEMRLNRQSFAQSLRKAQVNGYAEVDPTNDVEGYDAFYKTIILSRIAFGDEPDWHTVEREGIISITSDLVEAADKFGLRFKHVASLAKMGNEITASVKPVLVGTNHPFYNVEGVENAINVQADIVGRITLQGPGAGMFPTASAVIEDLVYVCQSQSARRSITKAGIEYREQQDKPKEEFWFVQGLTKNDSTSGISVIDQVDHGAGIFKASRISLDELAHHQEGLVYYPILGEYQAKRKDKVISV